ncbi:MAG TPA: hypothetical protein VJ728_11510 [Candidatus Binataceae bacterium]|nr:hypothetical protein [Candidatus Binataceae bacterium]
MAEDTPQIITATSDTLAEKHGREEIAGGRLLASAALIGVGVLVEPELLGGALLGAGVVYGLPLVGQLLRPVASTALQLGYSAVASASDLLQNAREQVHDIVATAQSDYQRSRGSSIVQER